MTREQQEIIEHLGKDAIIALMMELVRQKPNVSDLPSELKLATYKDRGKVIAEIRHFRKKPFDPAKLADSMYMMTSGRLHFEQGGDGMELVYEPLASYAAEYRRAVYDTLYDYNWWEGKRARI